MNSFLQLQEEDERKFVQAYQDDVRRKVESRLKTIDFISSVAEHFFPRLSDTVTVMMGGDVIHPEDVYLTLKEDDLPPPGPGSFGPDEVVR